MGSSGAGGGGVAAGSGGGRLPGGDPGAPAPAAGVAGGQALRSSDLLAQLQQRAASAAAAGLASTDGDEQDASQVRRCSRVSYLKSKLKAANVENPSDENPPHTDKEIFTGQRHMNSTTRRVPKALAASWVPPHQPQQLLAQGP